MAEPATPVSPPRQFDLRELFRVALWGFAATGALALVAFVSTSEAGNDRMLLAVAHIRGGAEPAVQVARADDAETRRLFETVRKLAADRDRLLARLDTLQRNVEDMTGSIARVAARPAPVPVPPSAAPVLALPPVIAAPIAAPPAAAPPAEPAPTLSAPATTASMTAPMTTPPNVWANVPVPRPAPQPAPHPPQMQAAATPEPAPPPTPAPDRPEFGIDLGLAPTMEGLRALWNAVRSRHAAQLEGLRPIVVLRERAGAGGVDLRLVVGPLPNAAAAARLCATLGSVSATCQPALFEGQRLALR